MKVFISWSGERSKKVAEVFADWLPQIIQALDPWISSNIAKGARSTPEISSELERSKIGIICLTPENLDNNWILFEAGALSKMNETMVCTFLLDLSPPDIKPPLSQFQHTIFTKEDVFKLIGTINQKLALSDEKPLAEKTLHQVFDRSWSEFDERINKIIKSLPEKTKQIRSDRDILEEILAIVRRQDSDIRNREEGLTESDYNILKISADHYRKLIAEYGVRPAEASRAVLKEIKAEGIEISPFLRDAIVQYLKKVE
jgi:hypothetical protein